MSDEQLPPPSSGAQDATMNETPPMAATPREDGSDFYNMPWTAGTPVPQNESNEYIAKYSTAGESAESSQPATLIPGLNLVNDSLQDLQPSSDQRPDEDMKENNPTDLNVEAQHETARNAPAFQQEKQQPESAPKTGEAMELDQHKQEGVANGEPNDEPNANTLDNPSMDATDAGPATETVQNEGQGEDGEHPEWEVDSSPYESSTDDSITDSSDDSDDEDYPILSPEEQAQMLIQAELGSDDEGEGKGKSGGHIKTANEVVEEAPPVPGITITPEMNVVFLGQVQTIVENTALIEANVSGEYQVLEGGSLLCSEDRKVVGVVCETLGRVEHPLYTVRYATAAAAEEHGMTKGKNIYYVEQHSSFVFTQPLKGMKGSDASNFHDEEIAEDEVEFSDDEAEAEYKKKLKQKRQERKEAKNDNARAKRGPPGPSKLSQTELNYDDDAGDDGYTPLARPKNLLEIMGQQEAPVEGDGPSARGSFRGGRGRGRGFARGRGGRGRGGGPRDQGSYRDHRPSSTPDSHPQPQPQPSNYGQPAYEQNQQPAFAMPQQYPFAFPQQLPQQQPYTQGSTPTPYPFQMPYMQAQNPYQQMAQMPQMLSNAHINPLFLAALQQQQQAQQQPQSQPQPQPQQTQPQTMSFDQVKAQLDLLRQLSNGSQGPPS